MAERSGRKIFANAGWARGLSAAVLAVAAVLVPYGTNAPTAHAAPANFVYREGQSLMLNGKPYKFVGFNAFGMTGCHTGHADSQATMDKYFGNLRPISMTRTWGFMNYEAGLDQMVKTAEKYNQKLMVSLEDGAGGCGRSSWGASWFQSGYKGSYLTWVKKVTAKYKDSPAIGVWEIMNEPGQSGGGGSQADMKAFYGDVATTIKATDPNHLVTTGTLDSYQSYQSGQAGYADVHSNPNIDLVSMHEYEYYDSGNTGTAGRFGQNLAAAKSLNKPIFIGEFGVVPKSGCVSMAQRTSLTKGKFDAYMNAGAVGALEWAVTDAPNSGDSACSSYDSKDAYDSQMVLMAKTYSNANLPTPNGTGTTMPTTPAPGTVTPTPATATPAPDGTVTVNDATTGTGANQFNFSGSWQTSTGDGKYDNDDHYSGTAGDAVTIAFSGTQIKVYGGKASHHGMAAVSIDGGAETMVDAYAADRQEQALLYSSPALGAGNHTLTLRVTGDKNAASSNTIVSVDKAEVLAGTATGGVRRGDLNGDGKVDVTDLSIVLSNWSN